jgi:hypothetical protein
MPLRAKSVFPAPDGRELLTFRWEVFRSGMEFYRLAGK